MVNLVLRLALDYEGGGAGVDEVVAAVERDEGVSVECKVYDLKC